MGIWFNAESKDSSTCTQPVVSTTANLLNPELFELSCSTQEMEHK